MPQVTLNYRRLTGDLATGELLPSGAVIVTPVRKVNTVDGLLTQEAVSAAVGDTIDVHGGTYRFEVVDKYDRPVLTETRIVPDNGGPFNVGDLTEVATPGKPANKAEWKAYVDDKLAVLPDLDGIGETLNSVLSTAADAQDTANAASTTAGQALSGLASKVDVIPGKKLTTEDYTTAEKSKLLGVATGATANDSNSALRDRGTHTGLQAISTVNGLQADLDAKATAISARVAKGEIRINVLDYTGATNGAKAVAACAAAPAGSTVFFPPGTYVNPTGLGAGITVANDNVTLELAAGAEIQCNTWGQPGIDCPGRNGIKVLGGVVRYTGTRGNHLGNSGRQSALYNTGCGVFINGDRCTVQGLRTIDMAVGVFLSSWATSTAYDHRGVSNRIKDIEVEGANWGVLWLGQEALVIDGLYFHDDRDDSSGSNPTHAIYCSSTDTYRSYGVTISNLITKNCLYGQPYQLKYCDNLTMTNLVALNSRGLLNLIGCVDLALTNANGTGCLASLSAPFGAITVQGAGAKRHRYQNIAIEVDQVAGVDQRTVLIEAEDSSIDGLTVVSKRTTSGSAANAVVQIRGLNNTARNLNITDTSGYNPVAVTLGGSSVTTTGTLVDGVRIAGCIRGFDLYAPASGVVRYSRAMVALTSSAFTSVQSGTPDFSIFEDGVLTVTGSPEGAVTATPGKLVARRDATTGDGVYVKASGTGNTGWQAVTRAPDIQAFTASGTWTKPAGAKVVDVLCVGPGAAGGSGRRGASGTVCGGGGGGAAGVVVRATFDAVDLGSTESVTIPTPGVGGASVTTDNTDGNNGGLPSGSTIFGSSNPKRVQAPVGASTSSGRGGTTTGGAGGISPFTLNANSQMSGGGAGGTGAAGTGVNPSLIGPAGGPGGGGISATPAAFNGGGGSYSVMATTTAGTGGVVDTTAPTAGTAPTQKGAPGQSGGGGASSITTAAQAGATATGYGAGGAGGGASLNGNNSGAGGDGGPGYVLVVTYF